MIKYHLVTIYKLQLKFQLIDSSFFKDVQKIKDIVYLYLGFNVNAFRSQITNFIASKQYTESHFMD